VSPTAIVTEVGEKKRSPIVTLAEADLWAFGFAASDPPPDGASVGCACGDEGVGAGVDAPVSEPLGLPVPSFWDPGWLCEPPPVSIGGVTGSGTVVVVVVADVVVPASCAAEIAGMAQLNASTSIPLVRALAPFIHLIVRGIDS
jgi:hypothetical protein